jgi:hypothetical protein
MTVNVPANKVLLVKLMSGATGIPYNVIACQANLESGFNDNAVSPSNAQGWLQFLPSTFYSVWHGSPFNPVDAANAYIVYMRSLLREEHGSLRLALAAYNAGPGNVVAGLGYADTILSCAGSPVVTVATPPGGQLPSDLPAGPDVQADDHSWYIKRSASWVSDTANSLQFYGRAIGRL